MLKNSKLFKIKKKAFGVSLRTIEEFKEWLTYASDMKTKISLKGREAVKTGGVRFLPT